MPTIILFGVFTAYDKFWMKVPEIVSMPTFLPTGFPNDPTLPFLDNNIKQQNKNEPTTPTTDQDEADRHRHRPRLSPSFHR
jgi:hypothetical protein